MKNAFQSPVFVFNRVCEYGGTLGKSAFKSQGTLRNCFSAHICLFCEEFSFLITS